MHLSTEWSVCASSCATTDSVHSEASDYTLWLTWRTCSSVWGRDGKVPIWEWLHLRWRHRPPPRCDTPPAECPGAVRHASEQLSDQPHLTKKTWQIRAVQQEWGWAASGETNSRFSAAWLHLFSSCDYFKDSKSVCSNTSNGENVSLWIESAEW